MTTVAWPSTIPTPIAKSFNFVHKNMGFALAFQSGRRRVTRTRVLPSNQMIVSSSFQLSLTLAEYDLFANFYTTYWKTFTPQEDSLSFTWAGQTWTGWPTSEVRAVRSENSWEVSFSFEATLPAFSYSYTDEESDSRSPLWPSDEFALQAGSSFTRITRDSVQLSEDLLLNRTNIKGDNFVVCEVALAPASIDRIFRIADWWARYCKYGNLPFSIPISLLSLGSIGGIDATLSEFYQGRFLTPPKFSFSDYFGTASLSFVLWPKRASFCKMVGYDGSSTIDMVGDDGSMLGRTYNGP